MEIRDLDEIKVVGIPVKGGFEDLYTEVPRAWQNLLQKASDIPHRVNNTYMDITLMKEEDQYTQLVGAEVKGFPEEQKDDLEYVTIPAQTYLHHKHEAPLKQIANTYGKIYEYARNNGLNADEFKIDRGYTTDDKEHPHDLYVRIEKPRREF